MEKFLVSACLLGEKVRYDGVACDVPMILQRWHHQGRLVMVCPEVAGGLPVPRPPAEINGGQGESVLNGDADVIVTNGDSVSEYFLKGASIALALCQKHNIRMAVLKSHSPSCGNERCYDGSFSRQLVAGQGVTAALLTRHGVRVFSELQLGEAERWLSTLDGQDRDCC